MVPVIRDADRLNFAGIEKAIGAYAVKAREGTMAVSDLQGGTFTITNGGASSAPCSDADPESAAERHPRDALDPEAARGHRRPGRDPPDDVSQALSYDHRIVDGREAVSFLVRIKECIENPERLMLEI